MVPETVLSVGRSSRVAKVAMSSQESISIFKSALCMQGMTVEKQNVRLGAWPWAGRMMVMGRRGSVQD